MGGAALDGDGTCNRSDDSGKKLEDLNDGIPFDFHFTQNLIVNIGHTDLIDHTDFFNYVTQISQISQIVLRQRRI